MATKRDIERRIEKLEATTEATVAEADNWIGIPEELLGDRTEAWRFFITGGESHPELESPSEQGPRFVIEHADEDEADA